MKLKIAFVFIIISLLFLTFVFRDKIIVFQNKTENSEAQKLDQAHYYKKMSSLSLRNYKGEVLSLDQAELISHDKLIVHFWASWCAPCVTEVPELIEYSEKNPTVKFIIVSVDDYTEDIEKFMKSFPLFNSEKYIRVWDGDKQLSKLFNVDRLPMSVIFSKDKDPLFIKSVVDWKRLN